MRFVIRSDIHTAGYEVQGGDITAIDRMCWRGDSRHPRVIFESGFRRRDDTLDGYFKRKLTWEEDARGDDDVPLAIPDRMPNTGALFRPGQKDIAPATAVCVSCNFAAASLFPLKGADDPQEDKTWVYAVYVQNGFATFQMQANVGARNLAFAQEACSHDIPALHVLGAVKISRSWQGPTWQSGAIGQVVKEFRANPRSIGCPGRLAKLDAARDEITRSFYGGLLPIGS